MKKDKSIKEISSKPNLLEGETHYYKKDRRSSTLLFVFIIILTLTAIVTTIYLSNKKHKEIVRLVTEQFNQQQLILARSAAISIENFIVEVEDDLLALSKLPVVQKMEPGILEKMKILFEGIPPQTSSRRLDKDGILRYIYPSEGWRQELIGRDYSQESYFQKAKESSTIAISSLVINEAGERRTRLIMPVYIENEKGGKEFNGVIICSFNPEILNTLFISPIISGKTGYAKLLNEEGIFLAHYEKEFVGQDAFKVRAKMNPELSYKAREERLKNLLPMHRFMFLTKFGQ